MVTGELGATQEPGPPRGAAAGGGGNGSAERRDRRSAPERYLKRVAVAAEQGFGPAGWNGCPVAVKNSGAPADV